MATAKSLQTPVILEIDGSKIRIQHPNISGNVTTYQTGNLLLTGTTLTVSDNHGFADDDFMVLGDLGDERTEEIDVNGPVTRGTSVTITNTTKFNHDSGSKVTKIFERAIKIYGAATDGGAGTLIASIDAISSPIADATMIQWGKPYTEYALISTDTAYAYYFIKFTDGTTDSSASIYVPAAGHSNTSVSEIANSALKKVNAQIDGKMIDFDFLVEVANDFQDEVQNYVMVSGISKDWSFEIFNDKTSIAATQNQNSYALSGLSSDLKFENNERSILDVYFGDQLLKHIDYREFDRYMQSKHQSTISATATVGTTSITLADSAEFGESGTIYLGALTVTYTANNQSTGVLSGIPASGSGSVTTEQASGTIVWQNISPGRPERYTVFAGNILLDRPVSLTYVDYKIKVKGLKKLSRLVSFASSTTVPFTYLAIIYLAYRIEERKANFENAERIKGDFYRKLEMEAQRDPLQTTEQTTYWDFDDISGAVNYYDRY